MKKFEKPTSEGDIVSEAEKNAFTEMHHDIEMEKNNIFEDPHVQRELDEMIESLPGEKEKEVIRGRFFRGETLEAVGKKLGLSKDRIRQIEAGALRLLRHPVRMTYVEGVELENRDKYSYGQRLNKILPMYDARAEKNRKMKNILHKIDYFTWGPRQEHLSELDSLTFNQICDEIKAIVTKKEYNDHDVSALEKISDRLEKEIEKAASSKAKS